MNYSKLKELDDLFAKEISLNKIKDASIHVEHKGKVVFENFYGNAKPRSIFKIYSMTKPITSVAAMILLERGVIDLEESVSRYIPEICARNQTVIVKENEKEYGKENLKKSSRGNLLRPCGKDVKIRDLLNMTSGMMYPNPCEPFNEVNDVQSDMERRIAGGEKFDNTKVAVELALAPLAFEPGEDWLYGTSADILGIVIEKASGMNFGEFLRKEIFQPLKMQDTWFHIPAEKMSRWMKPYSRKEDGHLEDVSPEMLAWLGQTDPTQEVIFQSGGGYLYSTLEDYTNFAHMLVNGGKFEDKQIISPKTIEYFGISQLNEKQMKSYWLADQGYGYANLMRVMLHPEMSGFGSVGEFGWDGLAGTYFLIDPKEELMVVYMQQIKEGGDPVLRRKYRNIIYSSIS